MVYGGIGRAARNWECFDHIVATLKRLEDDETLLVQSGKPVGVFRTHADAPRVLIANSNLVPHWATWEHFNELDRKGLMMYGQMTAGSWIYIGSQGIVQGTYETFVEIGPPALRRRSRRAMDSHRRARRHGRRAAAGGHHGGRVAAGRRMPAVAHRNAAADRLSRPPGHDLDEALAIMAQAGRDRKPVSVGLLGNAAEILPELVRRGVRPDVVTDQTSAHDPVNGYLPAGWTTGEWETRRETDPEGVTSAARAHRWPSMCGPCWISIAWAFRRSITATTSGRWRYDEGVDDAFDFPGFVPAYIRPLFCRGIGPFRWAALSGDPEDIYRTDAKVKELFPDDRICIAGSTWRASASVSGPAGAHLLARPGRAPSRWASPSTRWWRSGELKAPIVIGRDHLDSGSVASPNRETEAMRDGSDAVSDWPLLNALLNSASGATWVSLHHGGGVGMGFSQHAGMVIVCDGTPRQRRDASSASCGTIPATGVMRHADAGYEIAIDCARQHHLDLPSLG